ncbi:MAG: RnfH family protein [Neisseria sp.]|uniref:RnfH family protein n=1 Tax=Neisseria sp. TaxID=192066 RepID=UPI0026DC911E|nr:RnfH family protein [Neisseria sp.]MDO4640569.1 RnfH family protein [Neisseria sp.]
MDEINVEVVYGTANKQHLQCLRVPSGTTARQAVLQSGMTELFPQADLLNAPLGIFGKAVKDDTVLRDKDRVEIYRPLLLDPKEARRLRAAQKASETEN